MPGEPILIVDDTPVNLKLTRLLLVNEGYQVLTAASAEEALELLKDYHPHLVLADIQLPGIDGLEFTRRLKSNPATRNISVVALTAFAMNGDEQRAVEAGCDGYITKPIDTRAFGGRVREYLARRKPDPADAPSAVVPAATTSAAEKLKAGPAPGELDELRHRFLEEGLERSRQYLLDLDGQFNAQEAGRAVHQWIGAGSLLGYSAISVLAREVEAGMMERPLDNSQLRESLTKLEAAFASPREARNAPMPDVILEALRGKRVAVVGFPYNERDRFSMALERAQARACFFEGAEAAAEGSLKGCELAAFYVRPETMDERWLAPGAAATDNLPAVFVGNRDHLLELEPGTRVEARELLMDAWTGDEALLRMALSLEKRPKREPGAPAESERARVLLVAVDAGLREAASSALENFAMDCASAEDGDAALAAIRRERPHAVVLDAGVSGMGAFEVLAAVRGEGIPARVVLLTGQVQEGEALRAFRLGADDYLTKPFSPMELVVRLKRLLRR